MNKIFNPGDIVAYSYDMKVFKNLEILVTKKSDSISDEFSGYVIKAIPNYSYMKYSDTWNKTVFLLKHKSLNKIKIL